MQGTVMEIVRMKDKGQVTIPAALREELNAQVGDFFSMSLGMAHLK
jgi:bifunctional DNA-binding transcriptional regulator/antitoxin component of YhaV-PrlF toxin-antitoxin module